MQSNALLRTLALCRPAALPLRSLSSSAAARSAVKPGSESEATTPGAGSTEDIAHTDGAYDGAATSPSSAAAQIERETDADFSASSANAHTSEMATKREHQSHRRPSHMQRKTPDTPPRTSKHPRRPA
ncbi:uncharacterized protein SRS1_13302 [Sporisorium reilianum f. sp. reilianum]|uniref:Uncharacterized protein n=1 Tax=Sporisorium reilianum f. sp. reilianum TaxID=72559 RepID=A0A2N8UCK8_9BASI|nr:uncharacterized protein SRS1_13302 [Sporisorium reilianum f. sp. reilianum]